MTTARDMWNLMSPRQRVAIVVVPGIIVLVLLIGWIRSASLYFEVRKYESQASRAEAEKNEALKQAAAVASEIRRKEAELEQWRKSLDEEYQKLSHVRGNRIAAERELEFIQSNPRTDVPTPDELCEIVARAGHPCQ